MKLGAWPRAHCTKRRRSGMSRAAWPSGEPAEARYRVCSMSACVGKAVLASSSAIVAGPA